MRDDFPRQTITEIAKGVGYRCSNLECARPTVGANAAQDGVSTIGVAAHICAASQGGPPSKRPFGGPEEVLRYLARYTQRVAISNRRLVALDDKGVTFKWKDYRLDGPQRYNKVMTLDTPEFIRRFLMHVLPQGFHRIRYYGLLTSPTRAKNIARIRALLAVPLIPIDAIKAANAKASTSAQPEEPKALEHPCPCCGGRMIIIETFLRGQQPKHRPTPVLRVIRIDTS